MRTTNVIGAGLAGSIVTHVLRELGHTVRVFDDNDKFSASRASSNLFIRHWLKRFMDRGAGNGVDIIERLFPDECDEPFSRGLGYAMKVRHIAQRHIIVDTDIAGTVDEILDSGVKIAGCSTEFEGPTVVCTGWRGNELAECCEVTVKVGQCTFWEGTIPEGKASISMLSPYRHQKFYQFAPGVIYYSDSVALSLDSYNKRREELIKTSIERARKFVGPDAKMIEMRVGYRPIVKGHDFGRYLRHSHAIWSVNGGGKNGIAAYAHLAEQVVNEMDDSGVL